MMSFLCSNSLRSLGRPVTAATLLALAASGCARYGDVSGKVTYKGKALVWGTVQFEGSDHLVKQGNIDSEGTYFITGVATGQAKAAVSSINPKSSAFQLRRPERGQVNPRPEVKGWFPIPQKYDTPFNSGLTYTIQPGENQIDIELQ
jgi:hypothetical protein